MTELSFAKQFLTTLNAQPVRIPSDHVEDPKKYPPRPAYILPKMPRPMSKRQNLAPGQEASINITLRSIRNPPIDITLPGQPVSISVLDLKHALSEKARIPADKIRLLYKKKPCSDAKAVKDLVPTGEKEAEFSVMVIGGGPVPAGGPESAEGGDGAKVKQQRKTGKEFLSTEEFWEDLGKFLEQRLKDKGDSEDVLRLFRSAWRGQNISG